MSIKVYYKAVFNQDVEKDIKGVKKIFKSGEMFVSRMSEKNLRAFLKEKTAVKIINNIVVSFPTNYFDIYKVQETITYQEEKIITTTPMAV